MEKYFQTKTIEYKSRVKKPKLKYQLKRDRRGNIRKVFEKPVDYEMATETKYKTRQEYTGPRMNIKDLPNGNASTYMLFVDGRGGCVKYQKFELKAGSFGVQQCSDTFALKPTIGWAVLDTGEEPDAEVIQQFEDYFEERTKIKTAHTALERRHIGN